MEYKAIEEMVCEDKAKRMQEAKDLNNEKEFDIHKKDLIGLVEILKRTNNKAFIKYKDIIKTDF
ncbi:hypothetical protein [Colwellia echini]|uniref:Uncharacterized protein n=1 Tax=Colwellia echini TaxID=1982103 RepID=A0ABY3MSL9_9GAMM|nr:hypothetical protein [Colwellia echini]TYK64134.1 hypothetical protein CWS31_017275 [Colwellia echini]